MTEIVNYFSTLSSNYNCRAQGLILACLKYNSIYSGLLFTVFSFGSTLKEKKSVRGIDHVKFISYVNNIDDVNTLSKLLIVCSHHSL